MIGMIAKTDTTTVIALILGILGALIAVIELVRAKLQPFLAWGVLAASLGVVFLSIKVLS